MSIGTLATRRRSAPARPRTAFVLSGGGNQGVAQVGMLRALVERHIVPDVVIGVSAGALNGAAIARSPTLDGVEHLREVWCSLRSGEVFPGGRLSRAWNVLRHDTHLFSNAGLEALVERAALARTFADLKVPLRVVAADLDTGEEIVLVQGPLKPALLASAALPGVFPPVHHDGRVLVDGGVVNTVPLWHGLCGPAGRVYVLNVSGGVADKPPTSPLDVVMRAFTHARNQRFELELRHARPDVEIVILPRPEDRRELFDFSGAERLIAEAHALASAALDEHEQALATRCEGRRSRKRRHAVA
ncbi:MAG: patatin-like phospholipase family protein [Acidimicrobiia bacterium]|nr:patatin-like phospholipase family protein [Acidimicrobiia bacterium]